MSLFLCEIISANVWIPFLIYPLPALPWHVQGIKTAQRNATNNEAHHYPVHKSNLIMLIHVERKCFCNCNCQLAHPCVSASCALPYPHAHPPPLPVRPFRSRLSLLAARINREAAAQQATLCQLWQPLCHFPISPPYPIQPLQLTSIALPMCFVFCSFDFWLKLRWVDLRVMNSQLWRCCSMISCNFPFFE